MLKKDTIQRCQKAGKADEISLKKKIVRFRFIRILSEQRLRMRCSKKHILRALALFSMLSLIGFSERSKNLAGITGIARSDLHMVDQRRMLHSSSYVPKQ
jgi:hypothetical protein